MKNAITIFALAACILLAAGCENKRQNHKTKTDSKAQRDAQTTVPAGEQARERGTSDDGHAESPRTAVVKTGGKDFGQADAKILVPVSETADDRAETLGDVRKQLAELVQEAIRMKKDLLEAQLDGAGNNHGETMPSLKP